MAGMAEVAEVLPFLPLLPLQKKDIALSALWRAKGQNAKVQKMQVQIIYHQRQPESCLWWSYRHMGERCYAMLCVNSNRIPSALTILRKEETVGSIKPFSTREI